MSNKIKRNIIVTDMRYRMALAPARALAAEGCTVTGIEFDSCLPKEALGAYSKSVNDFRFLTDNNDIFASELAALCVEKKNICGKPVIIPVGRRTINILQAHPKLQEVADYIVPEPRAMQLADDKSLIHDIARTEKIPLPASLTAKDFPTVHDMAQASNFPSMVKFRNGEALGLKPAERYRTVHNVDELVDAYEKMSAIDADPIVQEFIEGHDIGIAVIIDKNGIMRDFLCYESLQEYPITGGPTCLCQTIECPILAEYAQNLLKHINFFGIAMLDFRGSADNPLFLEINPRIWGSANLINIADSKFFTNYVNAACGIDEKCKSGSYQRGKNMSFFPQHFAACISKIKSGSSIGPASVQYFKSAFNKNIQDGFNIAGDRKPFFRYLMNLVKSRH